ncbi:MAG: hypothetical protein K2X35_06965 [Bryobacteraceae bacterium]|nr:hypothetical protein [Bryobacteraceae bacterium]
MSVVARFVRHVVPGVIRPLRVLWNEVIGFFFIVLAVWFGASAIRTAREINDTDPGSLFRALISGGFTLVLAAFGAASFWKARKINRS